MTRILFLDIDYVLNSDYFDKQNNPNPFDHISNIDPKNVACLLDILNAYPDCRIVISSTWRDELSLDQLQDILEHFNVPAFKVIGCTSSAMPKDKAIEKWLRKNKPKKFVVLDDETLFDLQHPLYYRQVKTTAYKGLTQIEAELAKEKLK